MKKLLEISSFYKCVVKITVTWCMLPAIRSATDIIFRHFGPFFAIMTLKIKIRKKYKRKPGDIILLHMCSINEDHMMYGFSDIRLDRRSFLSCWAIFCPWLSNKTKNQNFEKMKKMSGDIILRMCTINENHVMYGYWDMERNRQNFFSFWNIFCPFIPLTTWEKDWKKRKQRLEISSLYTSVP